MIGFVFGHNVKSDGSDAFDEFQSDVDGKDMCLHEFMRRAVLKAAIYDRWYVMLDTTKPENAITMAQTKAAGSRILLEDLDPCRVMDWRDKPSKFLVTDETLGQFGGARLWDDVGYSEILLERDGNVASIGPVVPHGWSACPIVCVIPHCSGESLVEDIAEHQMSIFNLDSILKEELSKQTFSQWWLAGSGINKDDLQSVDVGSRKVLVLPVDANTVKFERLSSDPSQAESIRESMASEIQDIYRTLGLKDPTTETGPESGRALKIRFTESAFRATEIADMAEDAEEKITDLVGDALGVEFEDPEYPEDFDDESITEELDACMKVITAQMPQSIKRAQVSKWCKAAFTKMDDEELVEMQQEIEAFWPSGETPPEGQPQGDDLEIGTADEAREHPSFTREQARQIASDHLRQDPAYYRDPVNQKTQQNPAYAPGSKAGKGPFPLRGDQ